MTKEELEKIPVGTILKLAWKWDKYIVDMRVRYEGGMNVVIVQVIEQFNYGYKTGDRLTLSDNKLPYLSR